MQIQPFEATPPEVSFMMFALEIQSYLELYQEKGLSPYQYRDLICKYFPRPLWNDLWDKAKRFNGGLKEGCKRILFWYTETDYSLEQRVQDMERVHASPGFQSSWDAYAKAREEFCTTRGGAIMFELYRSPLSVREEIILLPDFNEHGLLQTPEFITKDRAAIITESIKTLKSVADAQQAFELANAAVNPSTSTEETSHHHQDEEESG